MIDCFCLFWLIVEIYSVRIKLTKFGLLKDLLCLPMVEGWTPYPDCVIIRCRGEHLVHNTIMNTKKKKSHVQWTPTHLMVDRVPRYTVDCPTVATQHSNCLIPPHMEDVHLQSQPSSVVLKYQMKVVTLLSSEPEATKAWSRPPKQLWIV